MSTVHDASQGFAVCGVGLAKPSLLTSNSGIKGNTIVKAMRTILPDTVQSPNYSRATEARP